MDEDKSNTISIYIGKISFPHVQHCSIVNLCRGLSQVFMVVFVICL